MAELRRWALVHHWGATRQRNLARFLEHYTLYLVDEVLIEAWAIINQRSQAKGLLIATGDAWVAATAWVQRIPLVTHNRRHFQIIDGLEVVSAEADEAPTP